MSKEIEVSNDSLDGLLRENGLTVLRFTAPWCGPCRRLAPVLEEVAETREDVNFVKVDCDENKDTPIKFGVRSIPHIVIVDKDGTMVSDHTGVCSADKVNQLIDDALLK